MTDDTPPGGRRRFIRLAAAGPCRRAVRRVMIGRALAADTVAGDGSDSGGAGLQDGRDQGRQPHRQGRHLRDL